MKAQERKHFGVAKGLRTDVFAHLLKQEMRWHKGTPTAKQVSRAATDVAEVDGLAHALTGLFENRPACMRRVICDLFLLRGP